MIDITVPAWVKDNCIEYSGLDDLKPMFMEQLKNDLNKFHTENPLVSIVIPAWNEEKNLVRTLLSLSKMTLSYPTELIVANNNSTDRTQELLNRLEVRSIQATTQGISYARQAGMEASKGIYILSADSDSIYPKNWIDPHVEQLKNPEISCVYGTYSFLPSVSSRLTLAAYETIARSFFAIKRKHRECVNVMGFNFSFKKEDCLKVGGYFHDLQRHITGRSDDGMMALRLMKAGKIKYIEDYRSNVWTSDRRLMADGSLGKAFVNRAKKELNRLSIYFKPSISESEKMDA